MSDSDQEDCKCTGDGKCLMKVEDDYQKRPNWQCTYNCRPIKCPNVIVCNRVAPKWYFQTRYGICQLCLGLFGCKLTIVKHDPEVDCPVCYETVGELVEFPANCEHFFCGKCTSELLIYDETRYHLSPVPYGGPECPNGCENPKKGRQCYCAELEDLIEVWKDENYAEWCRWNNAEMDSIESWEEMAYGTKKCPLCRKRA